MRVICSPRRRAGSKWIRFLEARPRRAAGEAAGATGAGVFARRTRQARAGKSEVALRRDTEYPAAGAGRNMITGRKLPKSAMRVESVQASVSGSSNGPDGSSGTKSRRQYASAAKRDLTICLGAYPSFTKQLTTGNKGRNISSSLDSNVQLAAGIRNVSQSRVAV